MGCDIPEYKQAGVWNHPPKRPRKLLMHRRELEKFADKATQKGLTLVPLRMYFNVRGIAKVELGLCKGKKLHDKREDLKKRDAKGCRASDAGAADRATGVTLGPIQGRLIRRRFRTARR